MSVLNVKEFFSEVFLIIAETYLASYGRHGTAMAIDGRPLTVMTIDDLQWSLSTWS